jgi:hypothetical protein
MDPAGVPGIEGFIEGRRAIRAPGNASATSQKVTVQEDVSHASGRETPMVAKRDHAALRVTGSIDVFIAVVGLDIADSTVFSKTES